MRLRLRPRHPLPTPCPTRLDPAGAFNAQVAAFIQSFICQSSCLTIANSLWSFRCVSSHQFPSSTPPSSFLYAPPTSTASCHLSTVLGFLGIVCRQWSCATHPQYCSFNHELGLFLDYLVVTIDSLLQCYSNDISRIILHHHHTSNVSDSVPVTVWYCPPLRST